MPGAKIKIRQPSESVELPFEPRLFPISPSTAMPMGAPDTASLTAMPELHLPPAIISVIPTDTDWREHPRWKPLIGTVEGGSEDMGLPADVLVPDPSPEKSEGSPGGSFIHRRRKRRGEYVQRPPVWIIRPLSPELDKEEPRRHVSSEEQIRSEEVLQVSVISELHKSSGGTLKRVKSRTKEFFSTLGRIRKGRRSVGMLFSST